MQRRKFLWQSGLLATGLGLDLPSLAMRSAELNEGGYSEKKGTALYERGTATRYRKSKKELSYIGMPVGGICCGTLYLGGDGRLWLWDVFNKNQEGIEPKEVQWDMEGQACRKVRSRDGACYVEPSVDLRPLQQGFAIVIHDGDNAIVRRFHEDDWDEILFEATYPVATITYIDKSVPLEITLQAYSPFIPGDEKNSGLPVTIQSFQIRNSSGKKWDIQMIGWLENRTMLHSYKKLNGITRVNRHFQEPHCSGVRLYNETDNEAAAQAFDHGDMALACLHPSQPLSFNDLPALVKENLKLSSDAPMGIIQSSFSLKPGQKFTHSFLISWFTPNLSFGNLNDRTQLPDQKRFYATLFTGATGIAQYVSQHFATLSSRTLRWQQTWYDSTLPWWFLERTLLTVSSIATTTAHRFASGRFYAWEGVGACPGTCTHVWQYAQAVGRLFPALERDTRQRVDLRISLRKDGGIWFRGESDHHPAIDGQAGTVLRIYREHQMSADHRFLQGNWKKIKRAIQFLIDQDKNGDGMTDTPMENTLDAVWKGEIAWIVGLVITAVQSGACMAKEMKDESFARICDDYVAKGRANMEKELFNGEYFIHRPDAVDGRKDIGSYNTCHIDQVLGQSWAWQVGLGRVLDKEKTISALKALWKYNFMNDVGPYLRNKNGWRPYALPGEGGMVMNTNPAKEEHPYGDSVTWQMGYFYECMTGFEHQVAAHLMAEGLTNESLQLTRAIHDRYHAAKRNPFNEIECSDHYARSMASYGTFISACGFTCHGPNGAIGFAPRINPENFKAPFTSAQGWGSFSQKRTAASLSANLLVHDGQLRVKSVQLETASTHQSTGVNVQVAGKRVGATLQQAGEKVNIVLNRAVTLLPGQSLSINMI